MRIKESQTTITFSERERHIINHFIIEIVESFQKYCHEPKKRNISCEDCPFVGLCNVNSAEELATRLENGINFPSVEM